MLQNWQTFRVESTREVWIMRNGTFFKGQSPSHPQQNLHMSCVLICVHKSLKETKRVACQEKGGIGFVWSPNLRKSQSCLLMLSCVHGACRPASILSVFLSSSSAVQNHVDRPSQWSSPWPVSQDPCLSLDHTKADSMSSASSCVCVRPPDSAAHVNLFIRQNVRELCVFVCVSMTQRDDGAKKLLKRPQLYFHCSGLV